MRYGGRSGHVLSQATKKNGWERTMETDFTGFPQETLTFLQNLSQYNTKAWFEAHRVDYEMYYMETARRFVTAIRPKLKKLDATITANPRVNKSLFRINRDIRFSHDKTPYKTHLDLWFYHGAEKHWGCSGFFFRLQPEQVLLAAGIYTLDKMGLARYRDAVDDDEAGKALARITTPLARKGYKIGGQHYKKVPRGYTDEHPRAHLLKHKSLYVSVETSLPDEIATPAFTKWCNTHYKTMLPLHKWLVEYAQVNSLTSSDWQ